MGNEVSRADLSLQDICIQLSELTPPSYLQSDAFLRLRKYSDHIDELYEILSTKSKSGNTLLHGKNYMIEDLTRLLTEKNKQRYLIALLKARNDEGQTVLHTFDIWSYNMVQQLNDYRGHVHTLCELLSLKDAYGNTPLHRCFHLTDRVIKLFTSWKCADSQRKLVRVLMIQNKTGKTVLHEFESRMNIRMMKLVQKLHDLEEVRELLSVRTLYLGNTVFHWNSALALEMVKLFRKRGKTSEILQILLMQNNFGDTALHSFSSQSEWNIKVFQELQDKTFALEISDLYSVKNFKGETVLHQNEELALVVLKPFESWGEYRHHFYLMSMTDANGHTVMETIPEDRRPKSGAWFTSEIKINDSYMVYHPHVVVIYMSEKRSGAEEEKDSIVSVFQDWSCQLIVKKDISRDQIIDLLREVACNATAIITVIMSHGTSGMFQDVDKKFHSLSDIETAMCSMHMTQKPKILIAQCCQRGGDSLTQDPGLNDNAPPDHPYAPKNDDFCAMLSCTSGEFSSRSVFIPKLAAYLRYCEKTDTIDDCFRAVKRQMRQEQFPQTPIMLSTLHKKVCLPNMFREEK